MSGSMCNNNEHDDIKFTCIYRKNPPPDIETLQQLRDYLRNNRIDEKKWDSFVYPELKAPPDKPKDEIT
jgi:hypothetical protein